MNLIPLLYMEDKRKQNKQIPLNTENTCENKIIIVMCKLKSQEKQI